MMRSDAVLILLLAFRLKRNKKIKNKRLRVGGKSAIAAGSMCDWRAVLGSPHG